mmetsp:Transcript_25838/g.74443  ORF Transcript_25838/g.74443 Transcript_25838/m.74443 type:complete len:89 (+) Transcript_25838:55-321(+)
MTCMPMNEQYCLCRCPHVSRTRPTYSLIETHTSHAHKISMSAYLAIILPKRRRRIRGGGRFIVFSVACTATVVTGAAKWNCPPCWPAC